MPSDILQAFARVGTDQVYDCTEAALAAALGRATADLIAAALLDPTLDIRGRIYQRARLAASFGALALKTDALLRSLPVDLRKVH